jgi:hypothetical protein
MDGENLRRKRKELRGKSKEDNISAGTEQNKDERPQHPTNA